MTKTSEPVESQMKRLGDAIELKKVEIIKDGLEAIVRSDERVHRTTAVSDAPIGHRK